ncbi:MAG: hypothetical protein GXY27_00885 [Erysipelotrichaceae bacterium]|jgi:hypothetical protein|nr:hypothetical protein [Erysipelotrichaceae bacterium]
MSKNQVMLSAFLLWTIFFLGFGFGWLLLVRFAVISSQRRKLWDNKKQK